MWSINIIIITISTFAIVPGTTVTGIACEFQHDGNETKNRNEKYVRGYDLKENTERVENKKINPNVFFGDILANALREFVIFSNTNEKCTEDGQHYATEFNNQTLWAVQMYDSSSKYPGGILTGQVFELGNFDQCLRVSSERLGIRGAHAVARIRFHPADGAASKSMDFAEAEKERTTRDTLTTGPNDVLWAVCVPDSCTEGDVESSMERVLAPVFHARNIVARVVVPPLMYTSPKDTTTTAHSAAAAVTFCVMVVGSVVLVVAGTRYGSAAVDRSEPENRGFLHKCLRSYSIVNNMETLMRSSNGGSYAIIDVIKSVGLTQVIIGHRLYVDLATPVFNFEFFDSFYNNFWLGFAKSQVYLESFFVVGGFLTYTKIEDHLKSGKSFNFLYFLAHRLVRILPAYIIVISIMAFILPYMGDGPMWKSMTYPEAEFCRKNWWINLLFLNTYVKSYDMCMLFSWYSACDMHFFTVGIFLAYVVCRWKRIGLSIFGLLFAMSIYLPAKYIYENKQWGFYPILHNSMQSIRHTDYFHKVYIRSEFRITTYLIGIATAYINSQIEKSKLKFSAKSRFLGCAACFLVICVCAAVPGYFYLPDVTYNPWHHVLCFTFQRIMYALTISYFLIIGSTSNFGFISNMFESKFFTFTARLSYIAYLVHFVIQVPSVGRLRQSQYETMGIMGSRVIGDVTTSLVCSLIIYLTIEAPFRNILNHVVRRVFSDEHNGSAVTNAKKLK